MKKIALFLILTITCFTGFSQEKQEINVTKLGTVNVKDALTKDLGVKLENLSPPTPDGDSYKAMLMRKKALIALKYPRTNNISGNRDITINDTLKVGKSFIGNVSSAGQPNDNSMAINNDGIVVSAFNSSIYIYDSEGDSALGELTLNQFSAQISMNFDNFDPKMIYDPEQDRFILIYLAGRAPGSSFIVVCFSETNDPMGNWSVYSLDGNPLNDNSWSDYPAISMTKEETFITINLLNPGGSWQTSFKQTVIWQIDKFDGYSGAPAITTNLWSGITEGGINLRNMHPVRGGYDLKSTDQYFLSNRNFADESDSVYLIKVDNTIASGNANISVKLLKADIPYFLAPSARQASNKYFFTNDSRVLGGIIENGKIQYVHHGLDPSTGNCVIYHGVISDLSGSPSVKVKTIGLGDQDFGYPNIVYGGLIAGEDKSVIGFNHSGVSVFAGHSAVYFDGENYSQIKMAKAGATPVSYSFPITFRWGDYLGMQRRYNETCNVWMSGYYGLGNRNRTWVSELILPGDCYDTVSAPAFVDGNLYPNPSVGSSEINFTLNEDKQIKVELISSNGQLIRVLYDDLAKKGENRLMINTDNLSAGLYYVRIYSEDENILTKKLIRR